MVALQNNFTTPEQSKRLLELGAPADSADCYWRNYGDAEHRADVRFVLNGYDKIHTIKDCYEPNTEIIPCWSAGRLIEIYEICFGGYFNSRYFGHTLMEDVLLKIEEQINSIDFSKLEE